ncbi:MAG: copper chaperone PCu(A)C [Acidimicrobiales bacterium]
MRRFLVPLVLVALLAAACGDDDSETSADPTATPTATVATNGDGSRSALVVTDARYRRAGEGLGAAYLVITNTGDEAGRLSAAASGAAGEVQLHETVTDDDGLMGMVEVPEGFEIPGGGELILEPGGKHLMLIDLAADAGGQITIELVIDGDTIAVPFAFSEELSAMPGHDGGQSMEGGSMDDGSMEDASMEDGQ